MKNLVLALVLILSFSTISLAGMTGEAIFNNKCAHCHGLAGQGTGMAPILQENTLSDSDILQTITQGRDYKTKQYSEFALSMPKFSLSDADTLLLVNYLKSLK